MFILITVGMIVRRAGLISQEENRHLNNMVFKVFFSVMMFDNIYRSELTGAVSGRFMGFTLASIAVVYVCALAVALKATKSPKTRGAMIQAIYRSNFVIMGLPIALNIYGGENLATTAVMVAVVVPIFNVLAVVTLEVFRGGRPKPLEVARQIIKNPLIIGAVCGLICAAFKIDFPQVIDDLFDDMAGVATPLALVILGISFEFSQIMECGRNLWIAVIGRLVVVPGLVLTAAALIGIRDIEFVTLIGVFAAPSAISSYTMAQSMDSDATLAGNAVIMSSMLACGTMLLWIFLFKSLGMF